MKKAVLVCLVMMTFAFAQDNSANGTAENNQAETEESILLFQDANNTDTNITQTQTATQNATDTTPRFSTFWAIFRMIIVLAIVVACIYAVMWFMKKSMKIETKNDDPFLRKVSSIDLAVGKSVQIVTLLDNAYILGVSDNAVNLIAKVDDDELVDAMNLYADENQQVKKPRNFADILDIFMPNGPREKKSVLSDSKTKIAELLQKQRERLNNANGGEQNENRGQNENA